MSGEGGPRGSTGVHGGKKYRPIATLLFGNRNDEGAAAAAEEEPLAANQRPALVGHLVDLWRHHLNESTALVPAAVYGLATSVRLLLIDHQHQR